ncbi:MAG TPA: wax ester/triacylglycerol synthase family O-acyltransferase [Nocardioidaceae bacterium]|nr:wax ester/triacylglycerol synthase family O-acyltransferase [Nocardioidaceae bacterium]
MTERLRSGDRAFFAIESPSTPMHNATLEIFEPPADGFSYEQLVALVADRLAFVPRYRQRLQTVAGGLAAPVWVDDERFDLSYHIRQSAVPSPGSMEQLRNLVSRIIPRELDRSRPLWEMYFIEGLEEDRFAILVKSHQTLVDGIGTIDLGQVILDVDTKKRDTVFDDWAPRRAPAQPVLLAQALGEAARKPPVTPRQLLGGVESVVRQTGPIGRRYVELLTNRRTAPESPINAELSQQRLFSTVHTRLEDYRKVRRAHGGTVNDVILATITGGLRNWLMTRAESVSSSATLRAMVPMSVIDGDLEPTSLGSQVTGHLLSLPIGESSPVVRLHQVSYALKAHKETGGAVSATRLLHVAGFAPTTFHALGSRVAAAAPAKTFNLVVTNVPGPQFPLYAAGATMIESYPVQPLLPGHALAIGVTSYNGSVYFGLNADRDALPDVDIIGQCIKEALSELVDSASPTRPRAPRGRKKPAPPTKRAAK